MLERLRTFIETGNFEAGAKLPPERELARSLGVSRQGIREAIKALGILEAVESRRGDGTYLKSRAALNSGWPAAIADEANFSMLELLEIRKMFEPKAAALATARASEADILEIEALRVRLEDDGLDWHQYGVLDYEFHQAILRAAGNGILNEVCAFLTPLLRRLRDITIRSAPDWDRFRADHKAIVNAIVRGEAAAAEEAMMEHMHHIGMDLISKRRR